MKKFAGSFISVCLLLAFAACASKPAPVSAPAKPESKPKAAPVAEEVFEMPSAYIPKYARDEAEQYRKDFLHENSKSAADLTYKFFYNEKDEACLEFTVAPKAGYTFTEDSWIGYTWGNGQGGFGNGEVKYTITRKNYDEAEYRMEERRKDAVFREIEKVVYDVAKEYNYDFFAAYGIRVQYRRPNVKKAVCEGYSDAVAAKFKSHSAISKVEIWSSEKGNHAWNVLILKDGRKLYCDSTWYGGNNIDEQGYVVDVPQRNPFNLTFDINEFNSQGGAINSATGKLVAVHFGWGDAQVNQ